MILVETKNRKIIDEIAADADIAGGLFREVGATMRLPDFLIFLHAECGLFIVERINENYAGIHAAIKKAFRGKLAIQAAKEAFLWIFEKLGVTHILARIQNDRAEVKMFAAACGMTKYHKDETHTHYEVNQCH